MNDRELIEELFRARKSRGGAIDADTKIPILVEIDGKAHSIDAVVIMSPPQVKQLYNEEGHRIVLYLNKESAV